MDPLRFSSSNIHSQVCHDKPVTIGKDRLTVRKMIKGDVLLNETFY